MSNVLKVFCITSTSQPFRVTLIGSRVIEPMSSAKMISSSSFSLLTLLIISAFSLHFVASLPTTSDEYEYPNDAGDEYVYDDEERSEEKYVAKELDVKITSEKKHVIVPEEEVIRLQCLVENNGESGVDLILFTLQLVLATISDFLLGAA